MAKLSVKFLALPFGVNHFFSCKTKKKEPTHICFTERLQTGQEQELIPNISCWRKIHPRDSAGHVPPGTVSPPGIAPSTTPPSICLNYAFHFATATSVAL